MLRTLCSIAAVSTTFAVSVNAAVLHSTAFDGLTTGALNQQAGSGNTGLSGNWSNSNTAAANSTATVVAGNIADLPTAFVNSFGTPSGSNFLQTNNTPAFRQLSSTYDTQVDNTLYFSFLYRVSSMSGAGGGLSFYNAAGNELVQFGMGPGGDSNTTRTLRINFPSASGSTQIQSANGVGTLNTTFWLVGKVVTTNGNDTLSLTWYSGADAVPVTESFVLSGSPTSNLASVPTDKVISHIRFNSPSGSTQQFDELRIGQSWADVTGVPEPTAVALLGLAGLGLVRRRRA
jgi:hypothetical protein